MGPEGDGGEVYADKVCLECSWSVSAAETDSVDDISRRALEHFLETGHAIESTDRLPIALLDHY